MREGVHLSQGDIFVRVRGDTGLTGGMYVLGGGWHIGRRHNR